MCNNFWHYCIINISLCLLVINMNFLFLYFFQFMKFILSKLLINVIKSYLFIILIEIFFTYFRLNWSSILSQYKQWFLWIRFVKLPTFLILNKNVFISQINLNFLLQILYHILIILPILKNIIHHLFIIGYLSMEKI